LNDEAQMQQIKHANLEGHHDASSLSTEWLRKAMALALELEGELRSDGHPLDGDATFRLRLARAQLLGAVDVLNELFVQISKASRAAPARSGTFVMDVEVRARPVEPMPVASA
jgi:hypothetical protein